MWPAKSQIFLTLPFAEMLVEACLSGVLSGIIQAPIGFSGRLLIKLDSLDI